MQRRRFWTAVDNFNADQDVFRGCLCIFDEDIEVAVLLKYARIQKFKLQFLTAAPAIFLPEPCIGELRVWILVEIFHIGMRRGGIEVEVVLLDVLGMIAFIAGQPEEPFFEYRILAVPQRQRETDVLLAVTNAA